MGNTKPITVIRYDDQQQALNHKHELERAGLSPVLINRVAEASPTGVPPPGRRRTLELQVPANEASQAVDILDELIEDSNGTKQ